jgi:hypothetical protein
MASVPQNILLFIEAPAAGIAAAVYCWNIGTFRWQLSRKAISPKAISP